MQLKIRTYTIMDFLHLSYSTKDHSQLTRLSWIVDGFVCLDEGQRQVTFEQDFPLIRRLEDIPLNFYLQHLNRFSIYLRSL